MRHTHGMDDLVKDPMRVIFLTPSLIFNIGFHYGMVKQFKINFRDRTLKKLKKREERREGAKQGGRWGERR